MAKWSILFLFILTSAGARADESVIFRPYSAIVDSQNQVQSTNLISNDQIQKIEKCGGQLNSTTGVMQIPVAQLGCTGLLVDDTAAKTAQSQALAVAGQLAKQRPGTETTDLMKVLDQVKYVAAPQGTFESVISAPGAPRDWAINISDQKTVILNEKMSGMIPDPTDQSYFMLHEAMGAAGIDDRDYSASTTVWTLNQGLAAKGSEPALMKQLDQKIQAAPLTAKQLTSGSTIVGQGGDYNQMNIKKYLLKQTKNLQSWRDKGYDVSDQEYQSVILKMQVIFLPYATLAGFPNPPTYLGVKVYGVATYNCQAQQWQTYLPSNLGTLNVTAYMTMAMTGIVTDLDVQKQPGGFCK